MEQQQLVALIKQYCQPCSRLSSFAAYSMKSVFERLTGEYITFQAMRAAMRAAGYPPQQGGKYFVKFTDAPEIPTEILNPRERNRRLKDGRV